jgi:hypothetical protein
MNRLRSFFTRHHRLALVLVALALCLKVLVPTGFMIGTQGNTITVLVCHDASAGDVTRQIVLPSKVAGDDVPGKPAKGECPYGTLSMASLGGADIELLAMALAFIIALGVGPVRPVNPLRTPYLKPPLRGPPALT